MTPPLKKFKIHKALNQENYVLMLSSYKEENRISIDIGDIHSKLYSVIETSDTIIGIKHEIGGPYPIIKWGHNQSDIYIGVDNKVLLLSLNKRKLISKIELDSPFIDLYFLPENNNSMLIIEECGVSKFSSNKNREWFYKTDLVTSHNLKNDAIIISQFDGPDITISLNNDYSQGSC